MEKLTVLSQDTGKRLLEGLRSDGLAASKTVPLSGTIAGDTNTTLALAVSRTGVSINGSHIWHASATQFDGSLSVIYSSPIYLVDLTNGLVAGKYYLGKQIGSILTPPPSGLTAGTPMFMTPNLCGAACCSSSSCSSSSSSSSSSSMSSFSSGSSISSLSSISSGSSISSLSSISSGSSISSLSSMSSAVSSGSGVGGCCVGLPSTLHITISGGGANCCSDGTFAMTGSGTTWNWSTGLVTLCPTKENQWDLSCSGGTWTLAQATTFCLNGLAFVLESATCSPFQLVFTAAISSNGSCAGCSPTGTATYTITL